MVVKHTGCKKDDAIKALVEANDDMINAVMKLTESKSEVEDKKEDDENEILPLETSISSARIMEDID